MVSLQNLYDKLEKQIQIVEDALKTTDMIGNKLAALKLPKNDQSSNVRNKPCPVDKFNLESCRNSEFRTYKFKFKPTIKHSILENKANQIITYAGLCKLLTAYILNKNLLNTANKINCDDFLNLLTGTNSSSFFMLLKCFGRIIA